MHGAAAVARKTWQEGKMGVETVKVAPLDLELISSSIYGSYATIRLSLYPFLVISHMCLDMSGKGE